MEVVVIAPLTDIGAARILITQAHLVRFMGSEIVTLELAEHLASLGAEVLVATYTFGDPIRAEFERLPVRVFEIDDPALQVELEARRPDLAWVHHHLIPEPLLRDPGECVFVFNHMAGTTPAELPLSIGLERALSSASLFVSQEALDLQLLAGGFDGHPTERLQIWANPAPTEYASASRQRSLRPRIAVISNHIPLEVQRAVRSLREEFDVELIGSQGELGASPRRVSADVISQFDAVITIGKTVQYALSAGTAVYCYDHFGGPGWITHDTIEQAERVNFSGRESHQKSAGQIVDEIRTGLDQAMSDAAAHRDDRIRAYALAARWESLHRFLQEQPRAIDLLSADVITSHLNMQGALNAYIRQWTLARGDADHRGEVIASLRRSVRERIHAVSRRALGRPAVG